MALMDFLITTGQKIILTFSGIAEFMQTHGFNTPNGNWYSILDTILYVGLPVFIVAVIAKWVIGIIT